jgi:hypothetical protein
MGSRSRMEPRTEHDVKGCQWTSNPFPTIRIFGGEDLQVDLYDNELDGKSVYIPIFESIQVSI